MFKKILLAVTALSMVLTMGSAAKAADLYKTVRINELQYPTQINVYPRVIYLNQNDTLHLTVYGARQTDTRIFMPSFNIDQVIPKFKNATLDLCFANPTSKVIWMQISAVDGKKIPLQIVINDFKIPIAQACSKEVDTSALNSIINYSTAFNYPDKAEPSYRTGAAAPYIRGKW